MVGSTVLTLGAAGATARVGRIATRMITRRATRNMDWNVDTRNLGPCGAAFSFACDTPVLMADGTHTTFEDLTFGDMVWAHDPNTGDTGPRPVTGIWPHTDNAYDINIAITVTEDHPFWNATDQVWEGLIDFDPSDQVLTSTRDYADVGAIDFASVHTTTAWDITVDELHTFYVQVGDTDILVHNCGNTTAPSALDDLVDLSSPSRRTHILDGEVRPNGTFGGGHRGGTGFPGKSEFPTTWSDDLIMHHVSDVATDPISTIVRQQGRDVFVSGTRDGIDIEVLIRNGEIWTAYPTNVPRNPR